MDNIDPAIVEAMGFSGFGQQPGKKRKFDHNDAFIDPAVSDGADKTAESQSQARGANMLPLGQRKQNSNNNKIEIVPESGTSLPEALGGEEQRLQALRHGVRNEQGDLVIFLPSFIADPWKDLVTD